MTDYNNELPEPGLGRHDEEPGIHRNATKQAREFHEQRSARARRADERRSAKTTRDVDEWKERPGQLDYPGVDTVEPDRLHEQRSERAQRVDGRRDAPIADSKEQWAQSPQSFDWPGVDTSDAAGESMSQPLGMAADTDGDAFGIGDVFEASRQTFELEGGLLGESDTDEMF